MGIRFNPFTGSIDYVGSTTAGPATEAPKLLATFDCDTGVTTGDLLIVNGDNTVTNIADNALGTIPNGIFGVAYSKPTTTTVKVMFSGITGGYSGLTIGSPVYISTSGLPTNSVPGTGIIQQVGFAISSTEFFVQLLQPIAQGA